jgi:ribosomal protein L37AE/L43A
MVHDEYRRLLSEALGARNYLRLLDYLNRSGRRRRRFLYWQEQLLEPLRDRPILGPATYDQIESSLRVCPLHGTELESDLDGVSISPGGAVSDWTHIQSEWFPHTDCGPVETGTQARGERGVWFCRVCRSLLASWTAGDYAAVETAPASSGGVRHVAGEWIRFDVLTRAEDAEARQRQDQWAAESVAKKARQLERGYITPEEAAHAVYGTLSAPHLSEENARALLAEVPAAVIAPLRQLAIHATPAAGDPPLPAVLRRRRVALCEAIGALASAGILN